MDNKIFLGGISFKTTEDVLLEKLQEFGEVTSLRIVRDHDTGESKGYAFATLDSSEAAQKAIDNLNNQIFDGRRIGVQKWIKRTTNRQG